MIECLLAWACLIGFLFTGNPLYLIASGTFATASAADEIKRKM